MTKEQKNKIMPTNNREIEINNNHGVKKAC
jgi:hypothetical protein